jgi:uncharacterized membrane protein YkvA (DUF1232 family)
MLDRLKRWARAIKTDVVALWLAARDPRTPWHAKAVAACVAAYALSPIDLIPDFIPVLGYLDDLLIVPAGILLAVRLIPADLMAEFREEAQRRERPGSRAGAAAIVTIWILCAALLIWFFWPGGAH